MNKILTSLLIMTLTSTCLATTHNQAGQTFLLVQIAHSAEIKAVPNQRNTYELTLKGVSPYVTYFANRPMRVSGAISNVKFTNNWSKAFKKDAPNADLVGVEDSLLHPKYLNYSIELTHMEYNATGKTFHYTVHLLSGNNKTLPAKLKLNNAALFIDGFCLTCVG